MLNAFTESCRTAGSSVLILTRMNRFATRIEQNGESKIEIVQTSGTPGLPEGS